MRALLMYPDRDFVVPEEHMVRDAPLRAPQREDLRKDLWHDLDLEVILAAMAADDAALLSIARTVFATALGTDHDTIRYRQAVLRDCLAHPEPVRALHAIAVEGISQRQLMSWHYTSRFPGGVLYDATAILESFGNVLRRLRAFADEHTEQFTSPGLRQLIAMLRRELDDAFFEELESHLATLRFNAGVLVSVGLGDGMEGVGYVLHRQQETRARWLARLLRVPPAGFTIRVPERDYAGARAVAELRDRGIVRVANIAAEAAEHVVGFFHMLARELGFYIGCLNLRDALESIQLPVCLPDLERTGARRLRFADLHDASLALRSGRSTVGNTLDLDCKKVVIITGANQGGKSSFLRSVGLAQLMMQCGMFVCAERFTSDLCAAFFTHYTREEDATMRQGKLDEELSRLSVIVDAIAQASADASQPGTMLLLNESFASTNEREGSEIAVQVVRALSERDVRVLFVTHLYEFARTLANLAPEGTAFLRAERQPDGTRTFRILPGQPLATSYGRDLYARLFAPASVAADRR
jgi:hypothetical protein